MSTIATQVSTWVSEWRCLAASERTSTSPPVDWLSIRSVMRVPIQDTNRASSTDARTIRTTSRPRPDSQSRSSSSGLMSLPGA
jgi:hypothetical protein